MFPEWHHGVPESTYFKEPETFKTCKGCRAVAKIVGEVEDLRQVMESMKRMVTGQGLEEKSGETGDQVARL